MAPKFNPAIFIERRTFKSLTMDKLATKMGVSTTTVWKWENGKAVPRPGKLDRLARLLGVRVEDLFA